MSYTIYITRQENWYDENKSLKISETEWKQFASANPNMIKGNDLHGNLIYADGNISVNIFDEENLSALADVATQLKAKLQGEDGEGYEFSEEEEE
jgi:hypothetical protein